MDQDKLPQAADALSHTGTSASQKRPYAAPRLVKYGHVSKLTTGSSGTKWDGGRTKRRCL